MKGKESRKKGQANLFDLVRHNGCYSKMLKLQIDWSPRRLEFLRHPMADHWKRLNRILRRTIKLLRDEDGLCASVANWMHRVLEKKNSYSEIQESRHDDEADGNYDGSSDFDD